MKVGIISRKKLKSIPSRDLPIRAGMFDSDWPFSVRCKILSLISIILAFFSRIFDEQIEASGSLSTRSIGRVLAKYFRYSNGRDKSLQRSRRFSEVTS